MRVTEKGQVAIPKPIRDKLEIAPGSDVDFVDRGETVVLERRVHAADRKEMQRHFLKWAEQVRGTIDTGGMDGKDLHRPDEGAS